MERKIHSEERMMNTTFPKYVRPERIPLDKREWIDRELTQAPTWCSVDLRDGNQALPLPMNPEKKLEYFKLLCDVGFKEIEVSFPSASQDDFNFVRRLIEGKLIPEGVRISVLTQARENLIKRTVEALKGQDNTILHLYVATSDLHSKIVFGKTHDEVVKMAVDGTKLVIKYLKEAGLWGKVAYEFSPEEFTDTDLDFCVELCKAVKEAWGPARKQDFILNLPQTVERRAPFH
ncbi:MAG: 2-isopropylmalate synthase, partial [Lentisphaeria bacterium]|nr:2-isopropylmalate synthase [Lentisphaeria bacterium]